LAGHLVLVLVPVLVLVLVLVFWCWCWCCLDHKNKRNHCINCSPGMQNKNDAIRPVRVVR